MEPVAGGLLRYSIALASALVFSALLPCTAHPQDRPAPLKFEIASIHRSRPDAIDGSIRPLAGGNGYVAENIPVKLMVSLMYKIPMRQIVGGPDWIDTAHFDIQAKTDRLYSVEDLHIMFQNLLADRFALKFHKETREGSVYVLTVDKDGLKMKPNTTDQSFKIPVNLDANGTYVGVRVPMPYLCWFLGQKLQSDERPVLDRTGLKGNYDFHLAFMPERSPDASNGGLRDDDRPSLFEAVKEQLGLHLAPGKGPVEYYRIDHIEMPSSN